MQKILLLLLLLISFQSTYSQDNYTNLWDEVENHEIKGRNQSALEVVEKIFKKATRKNNSPQIVKSFIYKSKFSLLLNEEAQENITTELTETIKKEKFPTSALLESIYADFLHQYLKSNIYKIRQRTRIDSLAAHTNFKTWDVVTIAEEIDKHYTASLVHHEKLKQIPLNDFNAILTSGNHKYQPTLFDFLTQRAIKYYEEDKYYLNIYREYSSFTNPVIFAETDQFIKESFITNSVASKERALKLYQQLEDFRQKSKNEEAFVDVIISRLNFAHQNASLHHKERYFLTALEKLREKFNGKEVSATIDYELANYHYKGNRNKAYEICTEVIKNFPDSDGAANCLFLKTQLEKPFLKIQTEQNVLPGKAILAHMDFKEIDTLYISVYQIPLSMFDEAYYYKKDSIAKAYTKNNEAIESELYFITAPKDYYNHTTEIALPELKTGHYLIVASKDNDNTIPNEIYGHTTLNVTNLVLLETTFDNNVTFKVLDRDNGNPVKNANFKIFTGDYIYTTGQTDMHGEFRIKREEKPYYGLKVLAFKDGDTIANTDLNLHQRYYSDDEEEFTGKAFVYLDRSIYRPGQTLYFKALAMQKKDGVKSVVPNIYLNIIIYDTNYDELKEFRLKTNEFGSVSGEFKLPKNILNGEFSIEVDEDYDYEEDEHPFWDVIDDFEMAEVEFSVEEYKRPRFEVTFDPVAENYVIGDTIKIKGNAKALLGSNVTQAKVDYSILRKIDYYDEDEILEGELLTDERGEFIIAFPATPDSTYTKENKPVFTYHISVDVTDINGETQSKKTTVNVGYHTLAVYLNVDQKLDASKEQYAAVETKNLNGEPTPGKGILNIYKLQGPERILKSRPWELPEFHQLNKDEFVSLFPYYAYQYSDTENWDQKEKVLSTTFNTEESNKIILSGINRLESGKYTVEVIAHNKQQDTVTTEKQIDVFKPQDTFLPDNQFFDYQVMNSNFKKDGYIAVKLSTALNDFVVNLDAHHNEKEIYKEIVHISNGTAIARIPVQTNYKGQVDVNIYWAKLNTYYYQHFSAYLPQTTTNLTIETLSFRNKLTPDQNETWSFKITDSTDKDIEAELLASMYDASLDQFKEHNWDISAPDSYAAFPRWNNNNSFELSTFQNFQFYIHPNTSAFKVYPELNWFGLHFNNTIYNNNVYLKKLVNKKTLEKALKESKTASVKGGIITGYVGDENGPLPGVNVIIRGSTHGTITDFDGNFSLQTSKDDVLVFSYIGYISNEVKLNGNYVEVTMIEDMQALEEVIVVGYGIENKQSLTSAVSVIHTENIETSVANLLHGKVAGVDIIEVEQPGDANMLRLRGMASVKKNKLPLLIIDGIPQEGLDITLHPQDIVDFTVLNNTSATALYGSRGSNGVIIITTKKSLEEVIHVEARNNLKETAFFYPHLKTDRKGEISFSFQSPQALTRWKLMLLAHTKDFNTGQVQKTAVTQKDLMVVPNVPRFLRENDTVILSAKVTNLTDKTMTGISLLQLYDALTMEAVDVDLKNIKSSKSFTIPAKGNSNLSWKLVIPEGLQALQYKIVAKAGTFTDGEESIIPVLSNSILVTEAKPLWIKAGSTKSVAFEKLKNNTSSTLRNHQLTLEYTSNPAWYAIQSLPYLMEYPYECAEQTFARYYANTLASHIVHSNPKLKEVFNYWKQNGMLVSDLEKNEKLKSILISETPWVRDAQSEAEKKKRIAMLFDTVKLAEQQLQTLNRLKELQLSSGGFPWFSGGNENEYITRHIIGGLGHLKKLNIQNTQSVQIKAIVVKAINYLDDKFLEAYERVKKNNVDPPTIELRYDIIHYLYVRSFYIDEHPFDDKLKDPINFYTSKCKTQWLTQNVYGKGMIALYLFRNDEAAIAGEILTALTESAVRTEEEGMYWKENTNSWYWHSAPIETQALITEAFSEINPEMKEIMNELKLWLLKNKKSMQWSTTKATTEAVYALLLQGNDWLSVADNTIINIGNEKIKTQKLDETRKEAQIGYLKLNWNADEITPKMATVEIKNKSEITGYGGFYWQYFEDLDKITDSEAVPLKVRKSLFIRGKSTAKNELTALSSGTTLKPGDLVTVRIEITSKNDMEFVHMKDMRASGLEPVNVLSEYKWQDGLGYYESTKDASTNFFFDYLPKGVYIFEYDLRVNNAGDFSNGITTIQSMYAPEFTSHSKGVRIQVKE